jgi:hypothetical protein
MMLKTSTALKSSRIPGDVVALTTFCDWLEASALFQRGTVLSYPDVVDLLLEDDLCESQTEAWQVISDCTTELERRKNLLGRGFPFLLQSNRMVRQRAWRETPAYAFCILLALARALPEWTASFGKDFTRQGELFELLSEVSLLRVLGGWSVHRTGWSRSSTSHIQQVVKTVVSLVGEPEGNVFRWTKVTAKEAGLDILCFRPFTDGRSGVPLYLVQCASGRDWEDKLTTPNTDVWEKIIVFAAKPRRAFCTPFSFLDSEFPMHVNKVQGMLLDRYRLLEPLRSSRPWLTRKLERELIAWAKPRIAELPWV